MKFITETTKRSRLDHPPHTIIHAPRGKADFPLRRRSARSGTRIVSSRVPSPSRNNKTCNNNIIRKFAGGLFTYFYSYTANTGNRVSPQLSTVKLIELNIKHDNNMTRLRRRHLNTRRVRRYLRHVAVSTRVGRHDIIPWRDRAMKSFEVQNGKSFYSNPIHPAATDGCRTETCTVN